MPAIHIVRRPQREEPMDLGAIVLPMQPAPPADNNARHSPTPEPEEVLEENVQDEPAPNPPRRRTSQLARENHQLYNEMIRNRITPMLDRIDTLLARFEDS